MASWVSEVFFSLEQKKEIGERLKLKIGVATSPNQNRGAEPIEDLPKLTQREDVWGLRLLLGHKILSCHA